MCTFFNSCKHACEWNVSWKVLENSFSESWKTLEVLETWKVLENSVLMSVQSGYRFGISNPGIFVTEHVHYAVLITVSA